MLNTRVRAIKNHLRYLQSTDRWVSYMKEVVFLREVRIRVAQP